MNVLTPLDAAIRRPLRRFDRRERLLALGRGAGVTVAAVALLAAGSMAADRWLILETPARVALSSAVATVALALVTTLVVTPLVRRRRAVDVARRLEGRAGGFDESLLTVCELVATPDGTSPQLRSALEREVAARLAAVDLGRVLPARRTLRTLTAGLAITVALGVIGASSPDAVGQLARRLIRPHDGSLPRPTSVEVEVAPGSVVVGRGAHVDVVARVLRGAPAEAELEWRRPGDDWRRAVMTAAAEFDEGRRFEHRLERLQESVEYRVTAGDFRSAAARLAVRERPAARRFEIEYTYPTYTGRPPERVQSERGDLAAVRGSAASLRVVADRPLASAALLVEGVDVEPRPLEARDAELSFGVAIERSTRYRLILVDSEGVSNDGEPALPIVAAPDRRPAIHLVEPRGPEASVEYGRRLPLRFEASDDFGVVSVVAEAETADGRRTTLELDRRGGGTRDGGTSDAAASCDLSPLDARPGETVSLRLVAADALEQEARSRPLAVTIEFLPHPPEGAGWLAGLDAAQQELDRLAGRWRALLSSVGDPETETIGADRAREELLAVIADEALGLLDGWRRLADVLDTVAADAALPSPAARGLRDLASALRGFVEAEGLGLWRELGDARSRVRRAIDDPAAFAAAEKGARMEARVEEGSVVIDAATLKAVQRTSATRLAELQDGFASTHRHERLEELVDRCRALAELEREVIARTASSLALQRSLAAATRATADELARVASLGGAVAKPLAGLAEYARDLVAPRVEGALEALSGNGELARPVERAAAALDELAGALERERRREEELAAAAWRSLERPLERSLLDGLAAAQRDIGTALADAAAADAAAGAAALADVLALDSRLDRELRRAAQRLARAIEDGREIATRESSTLEDLAALWRSLRRFADEELTPDATAHEALRREIAKAAPAGSSRLDELAATARGRVEMLAAMEDAWRRLEPAIALGLVAARVETVGAAWDRLPWRLRGLTERHGRVLRVAGRAARDLAATVERAALEASVPPGARDSLHAARTSMNDAAVSARELRPGDARAAVARAGSELVAASERLRRAQRALDAELEATRRWLREQAGDDPLPRVAGDSADSSATRSDAAPDETPPELRELLDTLARIEALLAEQESLAERVAALLDAEDVAAANDALDELEELQRRLAEVLGEDAEFGELRQMLERLDRDGSRRRPSSRPTDADAAARALSQSLRALADARSALADGDVGAAAAASRSLARELRRGAQSVERATGGAPSGPPAEGELIARLLRAVEADGSSPGWDVRTRRAATDRVIDELPVGFAISEHFPEAYRELGRLYLEAVEALR